MKRIPRPMAVSALALVLAGVTGGCSLLSDQTTAKEYTPADGVQVDLGGGVGIRNALFVAEDADAPGTLVATVVNDGTEDAVVRIEGQTVSGTVSVPARDAVLVGPDQDVQIEVARMEARPGELLPLVVSTSTEQVRLDVPVLDGTVAELTDLVPTPSPTGSPSPTASPTASPTS